MQQCFTRIISQFISSSWQDQIRSIILLLRNKTNLPHVCHDKKIWEKNKRPKTPSFPQSPKETGAHFLVHKSKHPKCTLYTNSLFPTFFDRTFIRPSPLLENLSPLKNSQYHPQTPRFSISKITFFDSQRFMYPFKNLHK